MQFKEHVQVYVEDFREFDNSKLSQNRILHKDKVVQLWNGLQERIPYAILHGCRSCDISWSVSDDDPWDYILYFSNLT